MFKSNISKPKEQKEKSQPNLLQSQKICQQIVDIFASDYHLIENRIRFLHSLNLPPVQTDSIKNSNSTFEFFNDALNVWISTYGVDVSIDKLCEILRSNQFLWVAEKIEAELRNSWSPALLRIDIDEAPVSFEVNDVVRNFTGRTVELERLVELFLGNQVYVATITGMGGIGKSELAKHFAHHLKNEYNTTIIWFNGQNGETLQESVNRLINLLHKNQDGSTSNNMTDSFLKSVYTMESKKKKRKLVIIDNVDEANQGAESLIRAEIPQKDCFFLITSRNLKVLNIAGEVIKLEIFPNQDAQRLVLSSVKEETIEDVNRLCELLENFPLALQQALAYIREQKLLSSKGESYKISDYVDSFATMKKEFLAYELNFDHDYKLTTLITWKVTIDKVCKNKDVGELAFKVLKAIAYFEPDRIGMDLLKLFFEGQDIGEIEKAIKLIKTYSLVKAENRFVSIHRLVQQVIQINTSDEELEVRQLREMTNSICRILQNGKEEIRRIQPKLCIDVESKYFNHVFDTNSLLHCIRSGIGHLLSVWNHNCNHPELITEFKGIPIEIIDVIYPFWTKRGTIDDVTYFTKRCYSLFNNKFGTNAEETLELESEVVFASEKNMTEAKINKLDEIYNTKTSILGNDNPLNLRLSEKISYHVICECEGLYLDDKRYCKYLNDSLRLRDKVSGRDHESTFPFRWKLVEKMEANSHPELVRKLNDIMDEVLPEDKKQLLLNMKEYGDKLFDENKLEKANYYFELWLRFKGNKGSKRVIFAKRRLSNIQYIVGDRESAFQTMERFVAEFEKNKKKQKLFLEMKSASDAGDRLVREGAFNDALDLFQQVTEYQNGLNFPSYLYSYWWRYETLQKLAFVLIRLGRLKAAIDILKNEVCWQDFVRSDHKLVVEKNKLLKEAVEGLRLVTEAQESGTRSLKSKRPPRRARLLSFLCN